MNRMRLLLIFATVIILSTFIFTIAINVNAVSDEEDTEIISQEEIDVLLGNPLTWLFGALLLIIATIINLVYTIFGAITAAILAVISAFVGIIIALVNGITSLISLS